MDDSQVLAELGKVVGELRERGPLDLRRDKRDPLLHTTVVGTPRVADLTAIVANVLGQPYKPAGKGAFFMSWFDPFVKAVGGVERQQTLFRRDLVPGLSLYCAFWPWASEPGRTSIRIGLACLDAKRAKSLADLSAPAK